MRMLFYISVLLSGAITVGMVAMTVKYTAIYNPNGMNDMWTNGNPMLFFMLFPMPIMAYFFIAMIFVLDDLHQKLGWQRKRALPIYTSLFLLVSGFCVYRIVSFKQQAQPHFPEDIGYLNPYSNGLFFNGWTLLAALLLCAIISFFARKPA